MVNADPFVVQDVVSAENFTRLFALPAAVLVTLGFSVASGLTLFGIGGAILALAR